MADWWPSEDEYTPGIDKQGWLELLRNPNVFDADSLAVMKRMLDFGGAATCKQLSIEYGEYAQYYTSHSVHLAKRVLKVTDCAVLPGDKNENSKYWPILYVGKHADSNTEGTYIWRLRPELREALEEIDLDNIPLYSKEDSDEVSDNNEIADTFDDTVVWMFQCNPKYYDIFSDLENHDRLTWSVRQHRKQIKKGHKVYLWLSGSDGGIIATGKIICDPELRKHVDDSQYWIGAPRESERLQVDIQIERKQIKPPLVSRSVLRENGQTKELKIFGYAQGTNYPVTNSQETAIDGIIKGLGKRIEYTESKFLGEVFLDPKLYRTLTTLLLRKKNVILKGAPGVGKTFAAKKLAFSMMGEKDEGRVAMVQFHQSYSYEDFVMGYRPNAAGGFDLVEGPFYKFCERAAEDPDRQYFFIIDEINRGNLSKVFGELLMLIEDDKRGQYIRLMYTGERFSVPKNLYVVGMMNTADRSLAMMDYALRRRFAFFDMGPAFGSNGFMEYQKRINNPKFDRLISEIKSLNEKIQKDESLGAGFRIGHSYFCTDGTITDEWLSSVVEYELIPLLEEYWFDEPLNVERWSAQLRGVLNG